MEEIRIFIVADYRLFRAGVTTLIHSDPGLKVVGEAADDEEAVRLAQELKPNVILLDLAMPHMDGIDAIHHICSLNIATRILALSTSGEKKDVLAAIEAGASGYLLKDSSPEQLLQAIRDVYAGRSALHPQIAKILMQDIRSKEETQPKKPALPSLGRLTSREIEVLRLVAHGLSNDEIAAALRISKRTVNTHINSILKKLRLTNRAQAVLYALNSGMVQLEG